MANMTSKANIEHSSRSSSSALEIEVPTKKLYKVAILISSCFIALLLFIFFVGAQSVARKIAADKLINELENGTPITREQALNSYNANAKLNKYLPQPFWSKEDSTLVRLEMVNTVYTIFANIELHEFIIASSIYRDKLRPAVFNLFNLIDFDADKYKSLHVAIKRLDEWSADNLKLAQLEIDTPAQLTQLEKKQAQQLLLSQELLVGFREFLGFNSAIEVVGVPEFYDSGVLAGLPRISQLPDKIETLTDLRNLLSSLEVNVSVKGENAPQLFMQKLEEYRSQSKVFQIEFDKIKKAISEYNSSLKELRLEVYQKTQSIKSILISILIIITS